LFSKNNGGISPWLAMRKIIFPSFPESKIKIFSWAGLGTFDETGALKGTFDEISSDPHFIKYHVRFTTVP